MSSANTHLRLRRQVEKRLGAHQRPRLEKTRARPDASERLFTGIRRRLTLWYAGALAAMLLISGILLYAGMQQVLFRPIGDQLSANALTLGHEWQNDVFRPGCPIQDSHISLNVPYVACYDGQANWIAAGSLGNPVVPFLGNGLAEEALESKSGMATDVIRGDNGLGAIQREALVVHDPTSGNVIGVVQVGIPIQGELTAMHTLLVLLLLLGALTLAGAVAGGILLSRRALDPARLAMTRQQAFIADASHELRTPLTLMRADAEVLLRGRERLDPDDVALLEDIVAETSHMAALAKNMLELARLDAGTQQQEHDVVDLAEVAASAVRRGQALANEKRVTLSVEGVAPTLVIGDRALLEQTALILLDNAIKYNTPGGSVTLRTSIEAGRARLEVRDTGIGIPSEHLPRLGERFYRVDKARSREAGGAGLGLSIARGIATAQGGALTLESAPGAGTTATLELPAVQ